MTFWHLWALPIHMQGKRPRPPEPTEHQLGIQARVVAHLIKHGVIDAMTVQKMGTTDARKMFTRLRRMGYLRPLDHPRAFIDVRNKSGKGKYRMHYWSGWQPKKGDRRTKVRGGVK